MKTSTYQRKHTIQRTAYMQPDDLNFAHDPTPLTHTYQQLQVKTTSVALDSSSTGLNIHKGKSKILKYNTESTNPVTRDGESVIEVKAFTYLVSIIDEQGGSDADVKARIGKARTTFLQLWNISNSKQLSTNIKVTIFNTNVKTVLLYGDETWRTVTTIIKNVQVFLNNCVG
ncbi:unnamed protein product [Schistosoma margrebowiei]|uniref:Uncharacterized protein n=1 Tax=Schistosoma margrebowiei TaxID=48269 RepID=A0A183LPV8_9TREM|nr:unnamed protein product [Schistosoma margrebowiei]